MHIQMVRSTLLAGAALGLAACGGGGGGVAFIPPPPVSPPSTCGTPPCFSQVAILPGVKSSTQLAIIGAQAAEGGWGLEFRTDGFAAAYDAASGDYTITIPSGLSGKFANNDDNTPNATWWNGALLDSSGHAIIKATVLKPANPQLQLSYTSAIEYGTEPQGQPLGVAAFGLATPTSAMPVTGTATYSALLDGTTFDGGGYIRGTASLQFDFGAGTLAGHLDPTYSDFGGMGEAYALGRYDFTNTVYASGSTAFSGELANPQFAANGSFTGQFTGPNAEELMARWGAGYINPITKQVGSMFGVMVGKH